MISSGPSGKTCGEDELMRRVRAKTTGISETLFEDKGAGVRYRVMDVGGQRCVHDPADGAGR
jgi:hypothetical protein